MVLDEATGEYRLRDRPERLPASFTLTPTPLTRTSTPARHADDRSGRRHRPGLETQKTFPSGSDMTTQP